MSKLSIALEFVQHKVVYEVNKPCVFDILNSSYYKNMTMNSKYPFLL